MVWYRKLKWEVVCNVEWYIYTPMQNYKAMSWNSSESLTFAYLYFARVWIITAECWHSKMLLHQPGHDAFIFDVQSEWPGSPVTVDDGQIQWKHIRIVIGTATTSIVLKNNSKSMGLAFSFICICIELIGLSYYWCFGNVNSQNNWPLHNKVCKFI